MDSTIPDRNAVLTALDRVLDPKSGKGLVAAGLVRGLTIGPGRAGFMLEVPSSETALYGPVHGEAQAALSAVPGVTKAQVVLTAEHDAPPPAEGVTRVRKGARVSEDPKAAASPSADAARPAHVRRVIAVASGKGGVGKSTVSVNLATAFAQLGLRTGVLDADVYGPSAPRMLGVDGEPAFENGKLQPLEAWGLKVMSIGFLVDEGAPMIWRGPMASSAVRQMMNDVAWGSEAEPLDVLVVDLPPGTGDIQLTLIQKMKIDGVVIVSTPQEIALIDARRAVSMFQKTGTPILGVIENMAFFTDPATGAPIPIFGSGGAKAEAARLGVPLLAEVPLEMALREACDNGQPVVATTPDSAAAQAFISAAKALMV
ncbi:MAG: Mrp/NBP35 family ATP-binding protein [Pseudomonadota bacterium]|uniref:Mrp/NBP35 family ATP-binding protein n=1 Tax=Phenylobacterium sp. TaxID=1871053 RepID=UPI0027291E48|nr:Mrp/NBP35 family ATP-binding protein [Phenylobacterium sp.]MDO9429803.1 Mrp/NBP35 family ATP-binding protein [Phenylobacterium sp.]